MPRKSQVLTALLSDERPLWPLKASFPPLRLSEPKGYELNKQGKFPIQVLKIGERNFVRRSDLLKFLGIEEADAA